MEKRKQPATVRHLAQCVAGLLLWVITMVIAMRVLHHHPASTALRISMVLLGVGGFVPCLVSVGRLIMAQDEFSLRLHLVAIALTCAATALLLMTGDYLQAAGLVGDISLQSIWLAMGVLWWLSIVISTWYYR